MNEQRYDVVVYDILTRTIVSVVGKNMPSAKTGNNRTITAETRIKTIKERFNPGPGFDCLMVPTGKYTVGNILPKLTKPQ